MTDSNTFDTLLFLENQGFNIDVDGIVPSDTTVEVIADIFNTSSKDVPEGLTWVRDDIVDFGYGAVIQFYRDLDNKSCACSYDRTTFFNVVHDTQGLAQLIANIYMRLNAIDIVRVDNPYTATSLMKSDWEVFNVTDVIDPDNGNREVYTLVYKDTDTD